MVREETIVNRLRRSTKRGKFSRAAWEFAVVLNSRQYEIPGQKLIQIYHNASILKSAPTLDKFKVFSGLENRAF